MIHNLLEEFSQELSYFLNKLLPSIDSEWWQNLVYNRLTFQQQNYAQQSKVEDLSSLDLASLIRVFDQNWYEISIRKNLNSSTRNWLKEIYTIRNRWAHAPAAGLSFDETYRDLDTLDRFLKSICANSHLLIKITSEKKLLLLKMSSNFSNNSNEKNEGLTKITQQQFQLGTIVRLKANASFTAAVIEFIPGVPEARYTLFNNGTIATYYESQIERISIPKPKSSKVSITNFHAKLTSSQLLHPTIEKLYSLYSARINFIPYQFRPVLKLIQADRPRLLIADEVGVGKTIEAGLILKELQARRDLKSVLVICPKALVAERKWLEELKRFDEKFIQLDGSSLKYCIEETYLNGSWPEQYSKAIVPYSLFDEFLLYGKQKNGKKKIGLWDLDPPPVFDLVIADEAHHIRNTETWAYRTVRYFCDNAEAVVLMSATPIQLSDNDLYNLLHLLRPDSIRSRKDFERMSEPNPFINEAIEFVRNAKDGWDIKASDSFEKALKTPWGKMVLAPSPYIQDVFDSIKKTDNDIKKRIRLIRELENSYTFSSYINRTRRRDIGAFTTRKPETVTVDFTFEQRTLHDDLINLISRIMELRHGSISLQFLLTTFRRQASSCIFGLAPLLSSMLNRHLSELELIDFEDEIISDKDGDDIGEFKLEIQKLIHKAESLSNFDPKLETLKKIIADKQKLENNKLLLFSSFRHTLSYLILNLSSLGFRFGVIHGSISEDERRILRNRFSLSRDNPNALDLLLSSEVGCEGLDYQFCDGLINYDLPWNPMRVEQRIGRIDRYGQKSEAILIYNFITPGTVDADIYQRCLMRIGVFRNAIGGSEEILGRLTNQIKDIAENLTLTDEERLLRLQQLSDNEVRFFQEQTQLEEEQAKLFGIAVTSPTYDEQIKDASSYWLSPKMLVNLTNTYIAKANNGKPLNVNNEKLISLRLAKQAKDILLKDFKAIDAKGSTANLWEKWLKGNDQTLSITFDPIQAAERRDITFINPTHPLIRQAALSVSNNNLITSFFSVSTNDLRSGRKVFAIYRWQKIGIKEDFIFKAISLDSEISDKLLDLLESAIDIEGEEITKFEEGQLEDLHYLLWSDSRANHIEDTRQSALLKMSSLEISYQAQIQNLEEQLNQATDERIRRMRESQINATERDFERRSNELQLAAFQSDIIAEVVSFGVIVIENNNDAR